MKKVLVLLLLALLPLGAFAQQKDLSPTQSQISYDIPLNGTTQGGIVKSYDKLKVDEIVKQITAARVAGDSQRAEQLQNELEVVTGNISEKTNGNHDGPQPISEIINKPVSSSDKLNLSIINGTDANWSVATSTDRVTGRIYVVSSKFSGGTASDSMKIFTSSDNGIHWVLVTKLAFGGAVVFRNDEIDVEALNNGTNSYIYGVIGLDYSGNHFSLIFRYNGVTGAEFYYSYLYSTGVGNSFLHPRITSDMGQYTSLAYVYILLTQDSVTVVGPPAIHNLYTKFAIITSPYVATPTIAYRNFTGTAYYWNTSGVADSTMMYNDIAYSDSAGAARIITVTNVYRAGYNTLYMTNSSNYGATAPAWNYTITESKVNWKPRLASTGYDVAGTPNLLMTYVRQWNATDWDPYYQFTSNNGVSWTGGYVDAATDTVVYADVIGISGTTNKFRLVSSTKSNNTSGNAYLYTWNGGILGLKTLLNAPNTASVNYTPVRAGFRLTTDSCFTIVQGLPSSVGLFAFSGCSGTITGIGNNETPVSFKLSQNYPNPFNPTTKISYALPKSGLVTLRIYDILGKEVATLVNEVKNAGNYSVDFNASNYTSGVYFYKIETNGFSDIKKMMLIK